MSSASSRASWLALGLSVFLCVACASPVGGGAGDCRTGTLRCAATETCTPDGACVSKMPGELAPDASVDAGAADGGSADAGSAGDGGGGVGDGGSSNGDGGSGGDGGDGP